MKLCAFRVLVMIMLSTPAFAEYCLETGQTCVEGAETRNIEGFDIRKDCWKYEIAYRCYTDNHTDYCKAIKETAGCELVNTKCLEQGKDSICNSLRKTYACGNLLNKAKGTTLLDSQYTITRDELVTEACNPLDKSSDCYEISKICVEGAETRNINGKDIYKDCWKYESQYSCFAGSHISDCKEYDNECSFISSNCLSQNKSGDCSHLEKKYICGEILGKKPVLLQCQGRKYCIGGDCQETKYKSNENIGKAISALSSLRNLQDDVDKESCKNGDSKACRVFNGQEKTCRINPLDARNCCKDKGWLKDMKLVSCNESEKLLGDSKAKGMCHEIGTYCTKKLKPTNVCIEKKRSYCCFQSRLARIIQEQGRGQLGIGWGSPESPNCTPLTVEQLQKIDFKKINFSEFYGEAMAKMNWGKQTASPFSGEDKGLNDRIKAAKAKASSSGAGDDYQQEIGRRINKHYDK